MPNAGSRKAKTIAGIAISSFGYNLLFRQEFSNLARMPILRLLVLALSLAWFFPHRIQAAPADDSREPFQFKFETNTALVYAVSLKLRTVTDGTAGNRSRLLRSSSEIRFKFQLRPVRANVAGMAEVFYRPYDYESDSENVGPSGTVKTTIRGLKVLSKQNDITIVDTAKDIGGTQGKALKMAAYPLMLSGYFYLDSAGNVRQTSGDLPFRDTWHDDLKERLGFFRIIFPTNAIGRGEAWTNSLAIKSAPGLVFEGDGIVQPHVFTREADAEDSHDACFSLYGSCILNDFSAYVEQAGQRTTVAIPTYHQDMSGTFRFDREAGRLIYAKETSSLHFTVNMIVGGNTDEAKLDCEAETTIALVKSKSQGD